MEPQAPASLELGDSGGSACPRPQPRLPLSPSPPPPELPTGSPASSEEGGGGPSHSSSLFFPLVFPPFLPLRSSCSAGGHGRRPDPRGDGQFHSDGGRICAAGGRIYALPAVSGRSWWCQGGGGDGEYRCRPWLRAQRWLVRAFFTVLEVL
ncbi:hypothetical protein GQ55_1G173900 [Panicum hallii var. hallii]|uniref:Uncharacterized protein n=1 Tax=Panicum hallii var. hallii TaxID=1504633 RepID=A0A2T7F5X5_9POAL|nr:hypothetical protein GQ55_1G173900 [Panicum hallii var. hallii]